MINIEQFHQRKVRNNKKPYTVGLLFARKKLTQALERRLAHPPLDHSFSAGCRLYIDPARLIGPGTPRSSSLVSKEKAPSVGNNFLFHFMYIQVSLKRKGYFYKKIMKVFLIKLCQKWIKS